MKASEKIKGYLRESGVDFEEIHHGASFSAMEEAHSMGVTADEVIKNLILKSDDGHYVFVAIPGGHRLSSPKEHDLLGRHARMITEEEMAKDFPGYEVGAIPPIGPMFNIQVYIDESVLSHEKVLITGGSHRDSFRLNRDDFINLNDAQIVDVSKDFLD